MATPPSSIPSFSTGGPTGAPREPVKGLPGWLILLGTLFALGPFSIDTYLPALPQIAADLHTDAGAVQRTLALYFVGLAIGQLIYGPFTDRFGRKPPLYVGLTLYIVASLGCAFAVNVESLSLWRFIQAMGGCACSIVPRAVVRDRCDARGMARALSLLMLVMGLAPILAPLLGTGIMALFGWRAIFLLLAAIGAACLLVVTVGMAETLDRSQAQPLRLGRALATYAGLLRDAHFIRPAVAGALAQGGLFAYIAASPFVLIQIYQVPAHLFGWIFGANAIGLIAASQINARLVRRMALPTLLRRAMWAAAGISGLGLIGQLSDVLALPVMLIVLFTFIGALGFVMPNTAALALQHQGQRAGVASALLGFLQFGMGTVAGLVISAWQRPDPLPLLAVMVVCGLGSLFAFGLGGREPEVP